MAGLSRYVRFAAIYQTSTHICMRFSRHTATQMVVEGRNPVDDKIEGRYLIASHALYGPGGISRARLGGSAWHSDSQLYIRYIISLTK